MQTITDASVLPARSRRRDASEGPLAVEGRPRLMARRQIRPIGHAIAGSRGASAGSIHRHSSPGSPIGPRADGPTRSGHALLDRHTAATGPGTGWQPALLAAQCFDASRGRDGANGLPAKSRPRKPDNLSRYMSNRHPGRSPNRPACRLPGTPGAERKSLVPSCMPGPWPNGTSNPPAMECSSALWIPAVTGGWPWRTRPSGGRWRRWSRRRATAAARRGRIRSGGPRLADGSPRPRRSP